MALPASLLTVRNRIRGVVGLFVLCLLVISAVDLWTLREVLLDEKKLKTRHLVEAAHSILVHQAERERRGEVSRLAAQEAAKAAVRAMRYEGREYFWIHSLESPVPRMVMHPTVPALDNQPLDPADDCCATHYQLADRGPAVALPPGTNLFTAFNQVARQAGAGYVAYPWPKPLPGGGVSEERHAKISYVKQHEPWGWVVGSGIYLDDVAGTVRERVFAHLGITAAIGAAMALMAALLGHSIVRPLSRSARALERMTRGDSPLAPLPVERPDEIGSFIAGFNHLQDAIKNREEGLRMAASVFDHVREGILVTDTQGTILAVNPGFTQLTGYTREEVLGRTPSLLKSGRQDAAFYADFWRALAEDGYWHGEMINRRKDGGLYVEMLTVTAVRDDAGAVSRYVGIFSDITALKVHESRLTRLAHHDALTSLPNRILLTDRLQLALKQADRKGERIAVVFLDLDGFKPVNDRLGHEAGDRLLVDVARRLRQCVRAGDTVARFGGDEFVLLLAGLENPGEAVAIVERTLNEISRPFLIDEEAVLVSASIGLTLYPGDEGDPEALLRHADQAMYEAKQAGRNRYRLFTPTEPRTDAQS